MAELNKIAASIAAGVSERIAKALPNLAEIAVREVMKRATPAIATGLVAAAFELDGTAASHEAGLRAERLARQLREAA